MKPVWMATAAAAAVAVVAPACAQEDPVKAGVDAWERGDYKGAVEKWRGPAIAGNADAQFNLGQAYKLGRGVPADLAMAEEWYRKAALQGHPQAQDNYGLALFQNGKRNDAVQWLERSSNRGEPRAQFVLGTMYFNGDAVTKDWVKAYALMTRSSQSGLAQASNALAQMDKYISVPQRQEGLVLARKYETQANSADLSGDYASSAPLPSAPPPVRTRPAPPPPRTASNPPPPAAAPVRSGGAWRVQLGAFGDPGNARKLWAQVGGRFPGRQPYYVQAGRLTKLLVGPFGSRGEAAGACGSVSPCVPVSQ